MVVLVNQLVRRTLVQSFRHAQQCVCWGASVRQGLLGIETGVWIQESATLLSMVNIPEF